MALPPESTDIAVIWSFQIVPLTICLLIDIHFSALTPLMRFICGQQGLEPVKSTEPHNTMATLFQVFSFSFFYLFSFLFLSGLEYFGEAGCQRHLDPRT